MADPPDPYDILTESDAGDSESTKAIRGRDVLFKNDFGLRDRGPPPYLMRPRNTCRDS